MTSIHVPNHHADHAGFSGFGGLIAALGFLVGRAADSDLAADLAELEPGDRLIDIGCGPGVAAHRADELGAAVTGVDPAPVMLRVARLRWARSRIAWKQGTAEAIPCGDGSADVVWSLATVHHWVDLDAGLSEVERVLAPGGRLVVLERHISDPGATGVASHGWTEQQAESFAGMCRERGFVYVRTGEHPGRRPLLSVVARR